MIPLTKHFTVKEMEHSQYATRHGLNNQMGPWQLEAMRRLCTEFLEPLRSHLRDVPIHVTSGFRSEAVNRGIGGAENSAHQFGEAVDFVVPGYPLLFVLQATVFSPLEFDQVIYEFGRWIHVTYGDKQIRPDQRRRQVLVASRDQSGQTVYRAVTPQEVARGEVLHVADLP